MANPLNIDFQKIKSNNAFAMISGSIGFLIVIFIIYSVYKYFKNKSIEQPYLIKYPRRGELIIDVDKDGKESYKNSYQYFKNKVITQSQVGYDYSYSIWLKIDDWDYKFNKPKHIFHKGPRDARYVNPGVWLYPKDNNLMIRVDTHNRLSNKSTTKSGKVCQNWMAQYPNKHGFNEENYPNKDIGDHNYCRNPNDKPEGDWCFTLDQHKGRESCEGNYKDSPSMNPELNIDNLNPLENCDIVNIPIQRWVNVILVMHNKTMDVYVNGKLKRSCAYKEVPKFNDDDLHITDNGGFKGDLSEFKYFNKALSPSDVYGIYNAGYKAISLYDKIASLKPNIKLNISVSASLNDEGVSASGHLG
uniref:Kringle domain-containing protein n=1 Tax=viral metagenome TaxID=1070528 RepID=A0A6C0EJB2_9ZZZZ